MAETWRAIPERTGYEASNLGRLRSVDREVVDVNGRRMRFSGRILRLIDNQVHRRYQVKLSGRGKTEYVSTLVALTFLGPRPFGTFVCHNDGNAYNNKIENLRYGTPSSNTHDAVAHGQHGMSSKTHCLRGHPLSGPGADVYSAPTGRRQCRACRRKV